METSIFTCRLFRSAMNEEQAESDYAQQFEEFKALAHEVFDSEAGYFAILETLDETFGILEECHIPKKISLCSAM